MATTEILRYIGQESRREWILAPLYLLAFQLMMSSAFGQKLTALTPPDTSVCFAVPFAIQAQAINGKQPYSFRWKSREGKTISTDRTITFLPVESTRLELIVLDAAGAESRDTFVLTVLPLPRVVISGDSLVCAGERVVLTARSSAMAFVWFAEDSIIRSRGNVAVVAPDRSTTYRVIATDSRGCSSEARFLVQTKPSPLSFDSIVRFRPLEGCDESAETTITLTNTHSETFTISEFSASNPMVKVLSPSFPLVMTPGMKVPLKLVFTPPFPGEFNGELGFRHSPCDDIAIIPFAGSRRSSNVALNVGHIDFGEFVYCNSPTVDTTIYIRNTGLQTVELSGIAVQGLATILSPVFPLKLPPNSRQPIAIRFKPTDDNQKAQMQFDIRRGSCLEKLSLYFSSRKKQITIQGSHSELDFGALLSCDSYRDSAMSFYNNSEVDVVLTRLFVGGAFQLLTRLPVTIPAKKSTAVRLRFSPTSDQNFYTHLEAYFSPCDLIVESELIGSKKRSAFQMTPTIDFGELNSCFQKSAEDTIVLRSDSEEGIIGIVNDITVSGPYQIDLRLGDTLRSGDISKHHVRFTPESIGDQNGFMLITLKPCYTTLKTDLRGKWTRPLLSSDTIVQYKEQDIGSEQIQSIRCTNTGNASVTIDSSDISFRDNVKNTFRLAGTLPTLPCVLRPGETLLLNIEHHHRPGKFSGFVDIKTKGPCTVSSSTRLSAKNSMATVVRVPSLSSAVGDTVEVPLILSSVSRVQLDELSGYHFTLDYPVRSLYFLDDIDSMKYHFASSLRNDAASAHLSIDGSWNGSDTLVVLRFQVMLDRFDSVSLRLSPDEVFRWDGIDPAFNILTQVAGDIDVAEVCGGRLNRSITFTETIFTGMISPNPANEIATVTVYAGTTEEMDLTLFSLDGTRMKGFHVSLTEGLNELSMDTSDIPVGLYFLRSQSRFETKTQLLMVEH